MKKVLFNIAVIGMWMLSNINSSAASQQLKSGQIPESLSSAKWQSIQAQIEQKKYQAYLTDIGGYKSTNLAMGWQIDYGRDGTTTLKPKDKNAEPYHIAVRLNSVSYQSDGIHKFFTQPEQTELLLE